MGRHKGISAAPEGDEEERQRIADITEQRGSRRRQPPVFALTQTVKDVDVENLP